MEEKNAVPGLVDSFESTRKQQEADFRHQKSYEELKSYLEKQNGDYDYELIAKAFWFCVKVHSKQQRLSHEEYYLHPFHVALIVASLGLDSQAVAAALLHDTVEDTEVTLEDIRSQFGQEVEQLVDGVTKIGRLSFVSKEEQQAENLRKMLIAMGKDIRVILIKLADRLHNMRTIDYMPEEKQRLKSLETLEVYAPIAHRLGIRAIKEELEDIAIAHLDPVAYRQIENLLTGEKEYRLKLLDSLKDRIQKRLQKEMPGVKMEFQGRVKSINGIYRKMFMQGKSFEEIYDVYAIRVITDTVADCYNILGVIHDMFRPIPNRFKDYISTPKPNLYQSLHTTVIGREGVPFEVQIRTFEMHKTAEYGIAAHWKYKAGVQSETRMDERLAWIRQILETQGDSPDASEILRSIKVDLAQEDVFAVTPRGDVINLPVGATVVDFAFAIHSQVGIRMVGAKVDGKIVPLNHVINTGEIIEILTTNQPGHGPSRDWINLAVTNQAKSKIRNWFKNEKRPENIENGRADFDREIKRNGILFETDAQYQNFVTEIAKKTHLNSAEDFYAAIGYGGIVLSKLLPRLKDAYNKLSKTVKPPEMPDPTYIPPHRKSSDGVIVEGLDNCMIRFSRCCAPLPGDEIIGFITRGHGVSIHKRDCINVPKNLAECEEPERWVSAWWEANQKAEFSASVQISAIDREGLLLDITQVLVNMRVRLVNMNARQTKDGNSITILTVTTEGLEHLKVIMARLAKVQGVYSVERINL